ncbi:MAG: response regulator transcription factor [Burkholderiales bacterium]|nr:response regulator transcription factor [Burkholderiales bacterium]
MRTRVLLTDDHRVLREALRLTLEREPDLAVVGEAGTAREALDLARITQPDVVVLDIGLPDLSGIEVATRLRQWQPAPRIVALSAHADKRFVAEMLRAGAEAYVTKSSAGSELVQAIRTVALGHSYLCPEVAGAMVSEVRRQNGGEGPPQLGRREREVLRLVAEGLRTADIAERLHIAPATVEVHRRNIMRKLDLHSVAELTRHAIREGIVSL